MNPLDELHLGLRRRLALVLQTEAAECGLACLAMIAGHHGNGCDIAQLRRRFGLSAKGATLKDLIDAADQLGLLARPLRLEAQELPLLQAPCILHWDLNHFVVLKKATAEHVLIHDPAAGARRLPLAEAL
jgi:ATP-binding cassette subfamily B protein RaxB